MHSLLGYDTIKEKGKRELLNVATKVCDTCVNAKFYFHAGTYWEPPEYGMDCAKEEEFTEDWDVDFGGTIDCPLYEHGIHSWEQLEMELGICNAEKAVYNGTECGAWIEQEDIHGGSGILLGSIVEGVDWGTETYYLGYPFTMAKFWETLEAVDEEAKDIWNMTHGCEHCFDGLLENEYGYHMIDTDCPVCKGEGIKL